MMTFRVRGEAPAPAHQQAAARRCKLLSTADAAAGGHGGNLDIPVTGTIIPRLGW